jgi:hypothetical protein
MKPDPAQLPLSRRTGEAIRYRDRNRGKLRALTAAAGLASVLSAAGVGYTLPGSAHTASVASRGTSGAGASGSAGASGTAGSSRSSSSSSASSSGGLQGSSAPSASSASPQVTSGGS